MNGSEQRQEGIVLRRFAGPASWAGRLSGVRVAHLTDLHVGRVTPMRVQHAAVDVTNAEAPDLVVITGDFVCHSQLWLDALTDVVSRFQAPVVAVLGNHDHWSGAAEVRHALSKAGVEILDNRYTRITLRGETLQLLGLDDAYTGHARRADALKGLDPKLPTLGLSHIAEEADGLWAHGVELVLSGHTHAGQVTLARLHELAIGKVAGHKYVHGLYGARTPSNGGAQGAVYVGAGIGAAIMPLRLGDRGKREVTVFELGLAPGAFAEHHEEQPALPGRKPRESQMARRHEQNERKKAKRRKKKDV